MVKVIMGIGVPGAGKTTLLRAFAQQKKFVYINPDSIREELTGSESDQSRNSEVWGLAQDRARKALQARKNVVFDATFAGRDDREKFIRHFRAAGAEMVYGVYCSVPIGTAIERNKNRARKVALVHIRRIHAQLKVLPPRLAEGFDALFLVNEHGMLKTTTLK